MNELSFVYPNGARKAATLRFDDGPKFDKRMLSLLEKHGMKATFYLSAGLLGTGWHVGGDEVKTLYARHEVANHTLRHIDPRRVALSEDELRAELSEGKKALEALTGKRVEGYAYVCSAFGAVGREAYLRILGETGHTYAVMGRENECFIPDLAHRFDLGQSFRIGSEKVLAAAREFAASEPCELSCFLAMAHTYEFEDDRFPYGWDRAEALCEILSGKDDIWYATNGEMFRYLLAVKEYRESGCAENKTGQMLYYLKDGAVCALPSL